ncbi:hypothetical protein NDU88_002362 [Pleurodeles waltl]|uniref:Uncharacterized protein n=1 Tax=Pleurodeles waltl TaxID=8319 RepID=A0AAV7W1N3_PLEWA|nr:hypothetical protein NDU88_002362 [Pleurodeles waltl]
MIMLVQRSLANIKHSDNQTSSPEAPALVLLGKRFSLEDEQLAPSFLEGSITGVFKYAFMIVRLALEVFSSIEKCPTKERFQIVP